MLLCSSRGCGSSGPDHGAAVQFRWARRIASTDRQASESDASGRLTRTISRPTVLAWFGLVWFAKKIATPELINEAGVNGISADKIVRNKDMGHTSWQAKISMRCMYFLQQLLLNMEGKALLNKKTCPEIDGIGQVVLNGYVAPQIFFSRTSSYFGNWWDWAGVLEMA